MVNKRALRARIKRARKKASSMAASARRIDGVGRIWMARWASHVLPSPPFHFACAAYRACMPLSPLRRACAVARYGRGKHLQRITHNKYRRYHGCAINIWHRSRLANILKAKTPRHRHGSNSNRARCTRHRVCWRERAGAATHTAITASLSARRASPETLRC
jgi:hypothetical protein